MRHSLSLGSGTALADGSPSMLLRALFALIVGCVAIVTACTDDATDVVPELQEQQAAVEVEQEVEQEQDRSTERRGAAPASDGEGGIRTRDSVQRDASQHGTGGFRTVRAVRAVRTSRDSDRRHGCLSIRIERTHRRDQPAERDRGAFRRPSGAGGDRVPGPGSTGGCSTRGAARTGTRTGSANRGRQRARRGRGESRRATARDRHGSGSGRGRGRGADRTRCVDARWLR